MRIKTLVLSMLLAGVALASDVTGKWVAQQPGRDGAARDGKIKGDNISFSIKREFNGNTMVMHYKGKVSGDEIKFSMTREGGDQPAREFTAKRSK
jgi:hypothetical protein